MTSPSIKVDGDRELRKALRAVADGIKDLKATNLEAAEIVRDEAKVLVPKLTGRLESSMRASGQAATGVVRSGSAAVPYAGVIHFGWAGHGIAPRPFLYDALDNRRDEVIERHEKNLNDLIRKHNL